MQHRRRRLIFLELVSQSQRGALLSFKEMVSASAASSASALACLDVPPRSRKDLKPSCQSSSRACVGSLEHMGFQRWWWMWDFTGGFLQLARAWLHSSHNAGEGQQAFSWTCLSNRAAGTSRAAASLLWVWSCSGHWVLTVQSCL